MGVSSAAVSKWERGIGFPDVSLMEPLAASLGITIAELFKGERTQNSVDNEYESLLSDVVKVSANEITWVVWTVYCFYRIFTEYTKKILAVYRNVRNGGKNGRLFTI